MKRKFTKKKKKKEIKKGKGKRITKKQRTSEQPNAVPYSASWRH